jgi:hypothetical protein
MYRFIGTIEKSKKNRTTGEQRILVTTKTKARDVTNTNQHNTHKARSTPSN